MHQALLRSQFLQFHLLSGAEKKKKTGMRLSASIPAYYGDITSRSQLPLIEGFTLSGFLRKETLGIISHNCNIMSKTVIGSNPEVIYVST